MKKTTLLVVVILLAFTPLLNAQVGIGTTNPKALLHIVAPPGTPQEESGIILPKVTSLPTGAIEKGMFVFLDSNNNQEGIYFYNGTKWEKNDNAWRLGGNTLTANEFIGTTNQKDLNFKVDNKQRLKIGAAGDLVYKNSNEKKLIEISRDGDYLINNANSNKLIEITKDGNYTINNANNNKLIEIKNNGVITLPHTTIDNIKSDDKSIATKEYVDANSSGGVLEEITEGFFTGYRINASTNAANYGNIGRGAVDLSSALFLGSSSTRGATGDYSFATGYDNIASGDYSVAMGWDSTASGVYAFTAGRGNTVSGQYSGAIGQGCSALGAGSFCVGNTTVANNHYSFVSGRDNETFGLSSVVGGRKNIARDFGEVVFGTWATDHAGGNSNNYNLANRMFTIGNGDGWTRSDALEVFANGTIYADELDIDEINDLKQLVTKEYVDTNSTDDQELTLTGTTLSITDGNSVDLNTLQDGSGTDDQTASEVYYNNSDSGFSATNVQDAIDELADSSSGGSGGSKSRFHEITGNLNGTTHNFGLTADGSRETIYINTNGSCNAQNISIPNANINCNGKIITLFKNPGNNNIDINIQTGGNILLGPVNIGSNFSYKRQVTMVYNNGNWYVISFN